MATSFILYKLPHQDSIHYIESKAKDSYNIEFIKSLKTKYFVVAPFLVDSKTPVFAIPMKEIQVLKKDEILEFDFPFEERKAFGVTETSEKEYKSKASIMSCKIKNGSYEKVVLSRVKKIKRTQKSLPQVFLELSEEYPSAFVYLLQLPNGQLWCGATPETLAKYEKGQLKTMALAGTQSLENKNTDELEWQEKEVDEQKWVQDAVKSSFKKNKVSVTKSKTYTTPAGHLAHIRTDFTAKCTIGKATQIVVDLHPTPAVCGTPTEEARKEIIKVESHKRQYYAGYLGIYSPQSFELFVNLRCMLIDRESYHLFVGGGLTKDSDAELEWQETEDKAMTLLNILS